MGRSRRQIHRSARKTVSIIVDGDTEVWYFQMLRETEKLGLLSIKPEFPAKKTLEDQFEMVRRNAEKYDEVIWLLDFDSVIKESREAAGGKAAKLQEVRNYLKKAEAFPNVNVLINTPCLEFWFLLHEKATGKFYAECEPVVSQLKRSAVLPQYAKTEKYFKNPKQNIYHRLRPYLHTAIRHAKQLGDFDPAAAELAKAETFKLFELLGIDITARG